jgi:hypothetical protein
MTDIVQKDSLIKKYLDHVGSDIFNRLKLFGKRIAFVINKFRIHG